jgi:hypothetical protein
MKKLCVGILLVLGTMAAFADTAYVLPAKVGRVYIAPTYTFSTGRWDGTSYDKYGSGEGAMKAFNLGFATEFGVLDWITLAARWAPGWNVVSTVDKKGDLAALGKLSPLGVTVPPDSDYNVNGVADLQLGVKFLVVGNNAPVESSTMRFSVAPGFTIPLPGADFKDQARDRMKGDDVTGANIDKHVFGFGGRVNYDYVFTPSFYLGLCGEFTFYPVKTTRSKDGLEYYLTEEANALIPVASFQTPNPNSKIDYGYKLMFEVEPHFDYPIADGFVLGAGLPMTITTSPAVKYDGHEGDVGNHYLFAMKPLVSMMFTNLPIPVQVEMDYTIPVFGKNEQVVHALTLLVKVFYALPGARGLNG